MTWCSSFSFQQLKFDEFQSWISMKTLTFPQVDEMHHDRLDHLQLGNCDFALNKDSSVKVPKRFNPKTIAMWYFDKWSIAENKILIINFIFHKQQPSKTTMSKNIHEKTKKLLPNLWDTIYQLQINEKVCVKKGFAWPA